MRLANMLRAGRGCAGLGALAVLGWTARKLGLRRLHEGWLAWLIGRTRLFDPVYYLQVNGDLAERTVDPLRHYAAYGDREGRFPMPFFDPAYYRAHAKGWTKSVNALLHFAWVGHYQGVAPSPWFDTAYYLAHNKDVARAGINPLLHYLDWGGLEGRSPSTQFDGAFYLRSNPDVLAARVNPLLHYLLYGRLEWRAPLPVGVGQDTAARTEAVVEIVLPEIEDWQRMSGRSRPESATVDVVVPVYKGRTETLRCLYSALASENATAFELVVVDDHSPDAELKSDLQKLAGLGLFTLLVNDRNLGFVQSVNRGMRLHEDRDVVLLNSDTEVYGNWLDRLVSAVRRNARTGTVTPLSNNATICSYPHFPHDNPYPLELGYDQLDALAATVNAGLEAELPTAVGFCMYIRRQCLAEVGLFDAEAFGKGYGEENDFCQRAIRLGWRNIVAGDVFVSHWGSTSFQGEKAGRIAEAMKVINRRYPAYRKDVHEFIARDPIAPMRMNLDWARLRAMVKAENVLIVCHNRGGGAERHVQEETMQLQANGQGVFYLRPVPGQPALVRLHHPVCKNVPNLPALPLDDIKSLCQVLGQFNITRVHAHGLVDFMPDAPASLLRLAQALAVPLWVDIHDYKVICPRINLTDASGRYCGEPVDEAGCNSCLASNGNDFNVRNIADWRRTHHQVLSATENIWVPDQDVADRLHRYYPDIHISVMPHDDVDARVSALAGPILQEGEVLRVVIIGAIGKIKGYDVILSCAKDAISRKLPIRFYLLGYSLNDQALAQAGVEVLGRYLEDEAMDKLASINPHVAWIPSIWPETYSYTLSLALRAGLPVEAFDIGAIAGRLRSIGYEQGLMSCDLVTKPKLINDGFMRYVSGQK